MTRSGFQTDFLTSLGGEAITEVMVGTRIAWPDTIIEAVAVEADDAGSVDFLAMYPDDQYSVAYAYAVVDVAEAQEAHIFVGHDDCAKIWLNGEPIHRHWRESGMGLTPRQFHLPIPLQAGENRLLVKVENWGYDWGFRLELFDADGAAPILQEKAEIRSLSSLQERHPIPGGWWPYLISTGDFPQIVWDDAESMQDLVGEVPLQATWYNSSLEEVPLPTQPGRYTAYVTAQLPDGRSIRRALTVFCRDPQWQPWVERIEAYPEYFANSGFDSLAFQRNRNLMAPMLGGMLMDQLFDEERGAMLLSYWHELDADDEPLPYETPDLVHNDHQVALKRKILGITSDTYPALAAPRLLSQPARVLHQGSLEEAEMSTDATQELRRVCQEWYQKTGEPFNVLIARHGVIVLHESFGPCRVDQKFSVASITKSVAGLTFARFVDQGLIELDEPIGHFLPDFPIQGPEAITMRQLFVHTSGLEGHGSWGGISNAWLDNVVRLGLHKLPVGQAHRYNGDAYNLAGKVMELVGGSSIQRLIQEQLWLPLGIEGSHLSDLGFSAMLSSEDIARMGQLLLNRGSYGQVELFAPETYEAILPTDLSQFYPGVEQEWGVGLSYRRTEREGQTDAFILSKDLIGHGSASSCIFNVDLEHDLV
ncbi:MAG: serine hydrolase, partial [Gemmatimonadetes bacterium]|nr:serine hydrolase [Gemmatimonadota bacterium]